MRLLLPAKWRSISFFVLARQCRVSELPSLKLVVATGLLGSDILVPVPDPDKQGGLHDQGCC